MSSCEHAALSPQAASPCAAAAEQSEAWQLRADNAELQAARRGAARTIARLHAAAAAAASSPRALPAAPALAREQRSGAPLAQLQDGAARLRRLKVYWSATDCAGGRPRWFWGHLLGVRTDAYGRCHLSVLYDDEQLVEHPVPPDGEWAWDDAAAGADEPGSGSDDSEEEEEDAAGGAAGGDAPRAGTPPGAAAPPRRGSAGRLPLAPTAAPRLAAVRPAASRPANAHAFAHAPGGGAFTFRGETRTYAELNVAYEASLQRSGGDAAAVTVCWAAVARQLRLDGLACTNMSTRLRHTWQRRHPGLAPAACRPAGGAAKRERGDGGTGAMSAAPAAVPALQPLPPPPQDE
jgi:hypothetical protein